MSYFDNGSPAIETRKITDHHLHVSAFCDMEKMILFFSILRCIIMDHGCDKVRSKLLLN